MFCVARRNSIGRSYLHPTFLLPANAPVNSGSVKTTCWLLLTAKAAYPPKTSRSHSWMSWNSRSTLANDSRLGTDNRSVHELNGGLIQSPTTDYMNAREVGNGLSR